jgi:hypothetical protein
MSTINDEKILALKKQIEEKKKLLGKTLRFNPTTNCSLELDGTRYNINTFNKDKCIDLMVKLNIYQMSYNNLFPDDKEGYEISGYPVSAWITDLKAKYEILNKQDEERKLKLMEEKLEELLSEDKKVEMQLSEIADLLK